MSEDGQFPCWMRDWEEVVDLGAWLAAKGKIDSICALQRFYENPGTMARWRDDYVEMARAVHGFLPGMSDALALETGFRMDRCAGCSYLGFQKAEYGNVSEFRCEHPSNSWCGVGYGTDWRYTDRPSWCPLGEAGPDTSCCADHLAYRERDLANAHRA